MVAELLRRSIELRHVIASDLAFQGGENLRIRLRSRLPSGFGCPLGYTPVRMLSNRVVLILRYATPVRRVSVIPTVGQYGSALKCKAGYGSMV